MADFKSIVTGLYRNNQKNKSNTPKPKKKTVKKDTGKAFTNEEIYRIMNASRLPIQQQKDYYDINPKLKKKVQERTKVAFESRPLLTGAMEGLNPISGINTVKGAVGDIDLSKTTSSAPYIVGNMLGQAAQYAMTGGLAQAGVANAAIKGTKLLGKGLKAVDSAVPTLTQKIAANAAADVVTGVPLNIAESLKTAKTPEEFAKNFAINTALDVGIGGAIGAAPAIVKALKAKTYTKPIADTLEKGGYVKDAQEAEIKVQEAVKNLTQRKLKIGTTVTKPTPTSQMIQSQSPSTTIPPTPPITQVEATVPTTQTISQAQPSAPTTPIVGKVKKIKALPNATILSKAPTEKKMNLIKEAIEDFRLRMVDTFTPQEDFARHLRKIDYNVGEKLLGIINKARNSREIARNNITNAQVDVNGREVGEALTTFMDRIPEDKSDLFQEYIFTKHHIDRLAKGKPILNLTKQQSIQRLQDISNSLTPAEMKLFNDTNLSIRSYIDNLRQYGIDTGLITQKQIDLFENMYPNYIKTARDRGVDLVNTSTSNPAVKTIIRNASRSDLPILPLKNQLEILTNDYIVTGNYNNMIREIAKAKGIKGAGKRQVVGESLTTTNELGTSKDTNFVKFFDNGKEYKLPVSKKEAKSYKILMQGGFGKEGVGKAVGDVLTPINTWFKLPITGVNPIFMVKNFMRDFEDALFYTKDIKGFLQNYPSAYKELSTKGDFYKLYQASGGKYSTFSNLDKDLKDKRTWFTRNISERIEGANSYVEQIPRMTEFMNVLKKELNGKDVSQATGDMINKASLAAAEITTNFGRSGDIGKYLNRTGVPFLNPSIQGGSRIIRQLTGQDGFKGYMRLATKALTLGIVPAVINEMIYGDDPEYQQFNDRDKLISFIFKVGDTWIKVPKGRLLSAMGMIPQGLIGQLKGDEYDFAEMFKVMGGQIGPVNPLESNLFTPLIQGITNKTWYGGDIDPVKWNDTKKTERYDETTSAIGKFLGGIGISTFGDTNINLSPRQWDYVIDGYTGIFGDTILPLLREDKSRRNPLKQAFALDPVMQNDLSKNFYALYDKTLQMSKEPTAEEQLSRRFMNRYKAKADEVLEQINDIQSSNLTPEQKETQTRELRIVLNNIYKNAEFELSEFQGFIDSSIAKYGDEEKGYEDAIIQGQISSGADEWEAYTTFMEGNKKDNYKVAKDAGITPQSYYELFDGRLDIDGSGGVKQTEAQSVLDSMDFTNEQKSVLWNLIGSGWKTNPYTGGAISTGTKSSGSKTSAVAKAYRDGLATKQVASLKNINIDSPNITKAELKAIIKMLSA